MARSEGRLVPVEELPSQSRYGKYAKVIDEFSQGGAKYARYETDTRATSVAAALKAAAKSAGANVTVKVIGGQVYLAKQ